MPGQRVKNAMVMGDAVQYKHIPAAQGLQHGRHGAAVLGGFGTHVVVQAHGIRHQPQIGLHNGADIRRAHAHKHRARPRLVAGVGYRFHGLVDHNLTAGGVGHFSADLGVGGFGPDGQSYGKVQSQQVFGGAHIRANVVNDNNQTARRARRHGRSRCGGRGRGIFTRRAHARPARTAKSAFSAASCGGINQLVGRHAGHGNSPAAGCHGCDGRGGAHFGQGIGQFPDHPVHGGKRRGIISAALAKTEHLKQEIIFPGQTGQHIHQPQPL